MFRSWCDLTSLQRFFPRTPEDIEIYYVLWSMSLSRQGRSAGPKCVNDWSALDVHSFLRLHNCVVQRACSVGGTPVGREVLGFVDSSRHESAVEALL